MLAPTLRVALPLLALALAAPAAHAQTSAADAPQILEVRQTAVTFTVRGLLTIPSAPATSLPTDMVERLTRDPNLAVLNVEGAPSRTQAVVQVGFAFRDEAAFRAWYEAADTREMLRDLEARLQNETVLLNLRRFPGAQYFEGTGS